MLNNKQIEELKEFALENAYETTVKRERRCVICRQTAFSNEEIHHDADCLILALEEGRDGTDEN